MNGIENPCPLSPQIIYLTINFWNQLFIYSFPGLVSLLVVLSQFRVFKIIFFNIHRCSLPFAQIFTNIKRISCPIVKMMTPSCSGRNSAHLEYPQCGITFKIHFPVFYTFPCLFTFLPKNRFKTKQKYFQLTVTKIVWITELLNNCCVVIQLLEQPYFCNNCYNRKVGGGAAPYASSLHWIRHCLQGRSSRRSRGDARLSWVGFSGTATVFRGYSGLS